MLWDIFFLWKRTGVDCFFLADGREPQNHLKQIAVSSQLHGAVLQFGQALCNRQAQTVAFALSGVVALNEALQQLVSRQGSREIFLKEMIASPFFSSSVR